MKIYFDKKLIQHEYISFLAPLLWLPDFEIWWEDKNQIKERTEKGKTIIFSTTKKDCDYFVYPKYFLLDHWKELSEYAHEAKKHKKKVIVFSYGEIDDYINIDNNIIWFKRSTKKENPNNEYCLPPFPEDFLKYNNNNIPLIQETPSKKYSIGYVWYADYYNLRSRLYYVGTRIIWLICRIKWIKKILMKIKNDRIYSKLVNAWIGNYFRGKVIRVIKKQKKYKFNFIQRKHALTTETKNEMRKQYIENLIESDFVLLIRWFWNYSIRQYEALSLGKIPIYIDTWAKLPFTEDIPYDDIFIKVPIWEIEKVEIYIEKYINNHKGELQKTQKKIRFFYENFFIMTAYYKKIISMLLLKTP